MLLRDGAFAGPLDAHRTHLHTVLKLRVVARTHLHIEHTAEGVVVVRIERGNKEVGVGNDIRVERTHHAETCTVEVCKVVGRKDFHPFQAVLHELWSITMYGNTVAVALS